jgi:hypothetical protein
VTHETSERRKIRKEKEERKKGRKRVNNHSSIEMTEKQGLKLITTGVMKI